MGKHWIATLTMFLLISIPVTTFICIKAFEEDPMVPIYITVEGLGEGKDMEKREFYVKDNAALSEVFSLEYPEVDEVFNALVYNNSFRTFMGVSPTGYKRFYVTINGTEENNLTQAYIGRGAEVVIIYR